MKAKIISLFNHKGGVSKTTTTFNLGWMMANKGYKTIIVDSDPQCNLTGMFLGMRDSKRLDEFYNSSNTVNNLRDGLAPAFESRPSLIEPVECFPMQSNQNLLLLAGHIGISEYDVTLGIAQALSESIVTLKNLPGSINYLLEKTAERYKAQIILVDMSPSLGSINQNILMTSDYFIIPMAPDYFSVMAIESLSRVLPKWKNWSNKIKELEVIKQADYPFPDKNPKFLGYIIQRYRPRSGSPSQAFEKWIVALKDGAKQTLVPALKKSDLFLSKARYAKANCIPENPLLQMSDFNSLIALSQEHSKPIFDLSDYEIGQGGQVLENTKKSMRDFKQLFSDAADKIIKMIL